MKCLQMCLLLIYNDKHSVTACQDRHHSLNLYSDLLYWVFFKYSWFICFKLQKTLNINIWTLQSLDVHLGIFFIVLCSNLQLLSKIILIAKLIFCQLKKYLTSTGFFWNNSTLSILLTVPIVAIQNTSSF